MKIRLVLFLWFMIVFQSYGQESWKKSGIRLPAPVCYGSDESHPSYIAPQNHNGLKSASLQNATVIVTYIGFSAEAQAAFQYAVDIWKTLIYSPVPIRIKASWESLETGVLGSCGPTTYYKNFNSTQIWNCYYPVALVEKMLREEVNGADKFDLEASFNKDARWYLGTDGKTTTGYYDFVSTVLHELTHGLGFTGYFNVANNSGSYGSEGYAAVFDQYVINKKGQSLLNKTLFPNNSSALYQELISGWLNFNTLLSDGSLPRLYAPSVWDDGSSIYHLDEQIYSAGSVNSLMTPFLGRAEAIHDVGTNALTIMNEMGWKSVSMKHDPVKDAETVSSPISFDVQIDSDYDLDLTKLYLYYSTNKFSKTDSILLKATAKASVYNAQLAVNKDSEYQYYFAATDASKKKYVFPSNAPSRYLDFKIGVDNELPVLSHEPVKFLLGTNPTTKLTVNASDNIGLKSVVVQYSVNDGKISELSLSNTGGDIYTGNLTFVLGSVQDGDKISYRIVAEDSSTSHNTTCLPTSGFYTFYVYNYQPPVSRYVNNFNTTTRDFISSDFSVTTASGFDSPALNSPHPYPSPDADDASYNFVATLKYPIVLQTGGKMSFDEIALVEPGETGSKFGDDNFWDYVIVEGSNDEGLSWKPLIDGYDSNAQKSWAVLYAKNVSGNNSTSIATKDLFVKREFELLANGNFKAGETIRIRFRLYSDPYSHGWGWIIDNLAIQDYKDAVSSLSLSSGEVLIYPNPASNQVNLQIMAREDIPDFLLKVYDTKGAIVYNQHYSTDGLSFQTNMDVSQFNSGLYLFVLEFKNGPSVTRKVVIN